MAEKLRLQLDTAALERLIGGDTDIELELRQSVVEEFARRHLKALANTDTLRKAVDGVQVQVADAIDRIVTEYAATRNWAGITLRKELADMIRSQCESVVRSEVVIAIHDTVDKYMKDECAELTKVAKDYVAALNNSATMAIEKLQAKTEEIETVMAEWDNATRERLLLALLQKNG